MLEVSFHTLAASQGLDRLSPNSAAPFPHPSRYHYKDRRKKQIPYPCKHKESTNPMLSPTAIRATPGVKEFVI